MKSEELRQLSKEELIARLQDAKKNFYTLEEGIMQGKEKNYAARKALRRDIARIETCISELSRS